MDLQLELESTSSDGFVWLGITKSRVGSISPSETKSVNLTIFPIRTGLINLSGIRIIDLNRGEKFAYNDVAQVLVMDKEDSSLS